VNHHRLMAFAVLAYVLKLEARRQVEVELHGGELPQPAEYIDEFDVDLGAVERRFAGDGFVGNSLPVQRSLKAAHCKCPVFVGASVVGAVVGSQVDNSTLNSWKPKVFSTASAKSMQATTSSSI